MLRTSLNIGLSIIISLGIVQLTFSQIVDLPDFQLKSCNEKWPEFLETEWSDDCKGKGIVQSDSGVDDGESADGCIQYRLYTFEIEDKCGNLLKETTRVSREYDFTEPEIVIIEDYTCLLYTSPSPRDA